MTTGSALTAPDREAIQATIDRLVAAFSAGDLDQVLASYEPGAVLVAEPGRPVSGAAELRAFFARFVALAPRFTFHDVEIFQAGDIAVHLNRWTMDGTMPDGTPAVQGGLSVAVVRRQADGRWLIAIDDPFGDHILKARG